MDNENQSLDFVLHANDVCTPAALQAYADSANAHGATDVATNVSGLANSVINFQTTNGSVLPTVQPADDTTPPVTEPTPPVSDTPQNPDGQPPVVDTPPVQEPTPPVVDTPPVDQPAPPVSDTPATPAPTTGQPTEFPLDQFNAEIADGKIVMSKKAS